MAVKRDFLRDTTTHWGRHLEQRTEPFDDRRQAAGPPIRDSFRLALLDHLIGDQLIGFERPRGARPCVVAQWGDEP
jgi:hypothetical protein